MRYVYSAPPATCEWAIASFGLGQWTLCAMGTLDVTLRIGRRSTGEEPLALSTSLRKCFAYPLIARPRARARETCDRVVVGFQYVARRVNDGHARWTHMHSL